MGWRNFTERVRKSKVLGRRLLGCATPRRGEKGTGGWGGGAGLDRPLWARTKTDWQTQQSHRSFIAADSILALRSYRDQAGTKLLILLCQLPETASVCEIPHPAYQINFMFRLGPHTHRISLYMYKYSKI